MPRLIALFLVILLILEVVIALDEDEEVKELIAKGKQARSEAEMANIKRRFDLCHLPVQPGKCHYPVKAWYYNHSLKKCMRFMYTLCGGNENRFYKKKECQDFCIYYY